METDRQTGSNDDATTAGSSGTVMADGGVESEGTAAADDIAGTDASGVVEGNRNGRVAPDGSMHCPACGAAVDEDADTCPECGFEHHSWDRLNELLDTASKTYRWGEGLSRRFPPFAVVVAYRQRKIESAQQKLHDYLTRLEAAAGEAIHCRACGEALGPGDASCPACAHENELATIRDIDWVIETEDTSHDPSEYETGVDSRWWVGVLAGPAMSLGVMTVNADTMTATTRGLMLALWIGGSALGIYALLQDRKYVRANSTWHPTVLWTALQWLPGISFVIALGYAGKRAWVMRE